MPLVEVKQLGRRYGDITAVDNISFELKQGDILGFLGPNGAGKSTTMKMLCGVLAPSEGQIVIDGHDLLEQPAKAKSSLGYLPEQPPLYRDMTVAEYLEYCARLHAIEKPFLQDAVRSACQRCSLDKVADRLIANLSKGYQQRVGIAQAIIHSPRVIVLDEPTVGLDPIQIREIRELIAQLGREHAIILSTHILPEVQAVCNRVQIINEGRLVYSSSMDELGDSNRYRISFHHDINAADLESINGVSRVSAVADGFDIQLETSSDQLVQQVVDKQWRLAALVPQQHNLEQIFIGLAHQDPDKQSDAA